MKKKIWGTLIGALCVAAIGSNAIVSAEGEKTKVTIWTAATHPDLIQAYYDTHPDANVEIEEVSFATTDYLTKVQQTVASGGDLPDVMYMDIQWRAGIYNLGILDDLEGEPYNFDKSIVFENMIPALTDPNGTLVGLEEAFTPGFIMYKKDLAEKYLGTSDREELEAMFQTFEDYATWGTKVYEESNGEVHLFPSLQDVSNMMVQQQRNINNVDEDGNLNVSGKVEKIFEVLEMLREANACGNVTQYSAEWNNAYGDGSVIFIPGAYWSMHYFVEAYDPEGIDNWGLCTPAGGSFGWGGSSYGICKDSEVKEAAWDYISWICTSEEAAQYNKDLYCYFMPIKSLYEDPEYTAGTRANFGDLQIYKYMIEDIAANMPVASPSVYDSMLADSVSMISEAMSVDTSMDSAVAMEEFMTDLQMKVSEVTVK